MSNAEKAERQIARSIETIEAEQALLGAILIDAGVMTAARETRLSPDHFSDPVHARIFSIMNDLLDEHRPITPGTLKKSFENLEIIGGLSTGEYIARIMANAVLPQDAKQHAFEILAGAARREIVAAFTEGLEALEANTRGAMIIDETTSRLQEIREEYSGKETTRVDLGNAARDAINQAREMKASGRRIAGISTGLHDLDRATGGWQKKEMVVIGGRPSMGKTAVATSLVLSAAKAGHGVLYFSLEMDAARLAERCLTDLAWSHTASIQYTNIRNGVLEDHEIERLDKAAEELRELPFVIEHAPSLTIGQMQAIARQVRSRMEKQGYSLDLICVDHMDKIRASGYWKGNAVQEAGEKSAGLFAMAKELDVAMIALKQLSRGPENRDDKRPTLADLRMSGDVEQDADTIIFPYREAYYLERTVCKKPEDETDRLASLADCRNMLELHIAKSRSGPTKTLKVFCDIAASAVRSYQ